MQYCLCTPAEEAQLPPSGSDLDGRARLYNRHFAMIKKKISYDITPNVRLIRRGSSRIVLCNRRRTDKSTILYTTYMFLFGKKKFIFFPRSNYRAKVFRERDSRAANRWMKKNKNIYSPENTGRSAMRLWRRRLLRRRWERGNAAETTEPSAVDRGPYRAYV